MNPDEHLFVRDRNFESASKRRDGLSFVRHSLQSSPTLRSRNATTLGCRRDREKVDTPVVVVIWVVKRQPDEPRDLGLAEIIRTNEHVDVAELIAGHVALDLVNTVS